MKMTSYWLDMATPFGAAMQGGPEGRADVAVVGAGFTGLSAALALAKKGAKVIVLEAGHVANAASGRNGGICNNDFAQDYYTSGHGTHMATYMGSMAEMLDGRVDLNPWLDMAWPAIPGYFGTPWFLPFVGAYYRYLDLVK